MYNIFYAQHILCTIYSMCNIFYLQHILCTIYSITKYALYNMFYVKHILCTTYCIDNIFYVQNMLYTIYPMNNIFYVKHILCTVYSMYNIFYIKYILCTTYSMYKHGHLFLRLLDNKYYSFLTSWFVNLPNIADDWGEIIHLILNVTSSYHIPEKIYSDWLPSWSFQWPLSCRDRPWPLLFQIIDHPSFQWRMTSNFRSVYKQLIIKAMN
jgi:hypothetical protein